MAKYTTTRRTGERIARALGLDPDHVMEGLRIVSEYPGIPRIELTIMPTPEQQKKITAAMLAEAEEVLALAAERAARAEVIAQLYDEPAIITAADYTVPTALPVDVYGHKTVNTSEAPGASGTE